MTDYATAFVDCETTGLSPDHHELWEVAVIRRHGDGPDVEYLWQVRPDLAAADPEALKIGRYHERFAVPDGYDAIEIFPSGPPLRSTLPEMVFDLQDVLKDAVLVGCNPAFDEGFLKELLRAHGLKTRWHYRTVDVATLAAGYLHATGQVGEPVPALPFSSRDLSRRVGVEPPGDGVAHTALGDARWARDVYDAITGIA